jgi:hypothetical protein
VCVSPIAPGKPGSVQLEAVSSTELSLTWTSPSDPNGVIRGYRIVWSIVRDDKNMSVTNNISKTGIIKNGSAVSFRIYTLGKHGGAGEFARLFYIITLSCKCCWFKQIFKETLRLTFTKNR